MIKEIKDLLKDLSDRAIECSYCDGTGIMPHDKTSACDHCGGQGEQLDATAYISDIRNILEKINRSESIKDF